ncbi:MAG TPA: glycogen/starch/alpha-glucan phosphorylase [Turneriella sp.]|nr:glycogen/starch/alpha-glucan phosphorylase [Turneriella sp.]
MMADYDKRDNWIIKGINNTARSGKFSSDRTVLQYAKETWKIIE